MVQCHKCHKIHNEKECPRCGNPNIQYCSQNLNRSSNSEVDKNG